MMDGSKAGAPEAGHTPGRWTLVGDVKSGKSFFVYSALWSLRNATDFPVFIPDRTDRLLQDRMREHMLRGAPDATAGSVLDYEFFLKSGSDPGLRKISITDGPGLALHPNFTSIDPLGGPVSEAYRKLAYGSDSLILVLPFLDRPGPGGPGLFDIVLQFVGSLHEFAGERLKRIAVCISKVDLSNDFEEAAAGGDLRALTANALRQTDPGGKLIASVRNFALLRRELQAAVFPVSSFGTVRGTGRRNLIPGMELPLLNHFESSFATTRFGSPVYPRPFHESEVNALWVPFNVEAPFRFLTTGEFRKGSGLMINDRELR